MPNELNVNKLLTAIIDGTVENLAEAMAQPGDDVLMIQADRYCGIRRPRLRS